MKTQGLLKLEKGFIDERKASMRSARDSYIGQQEGALADVKPGV